jgi:hypothetical protein
MMNPLGPTRLCWVVMLVPLLTVMMPAASAQTVTAPPDFTIIVQAHPTHFYDEIDEIEVAVNTVGEANIKEFRIGGETGQPVAARSVQLDRSALDAVYQAVSDADFFNQPALITDPLISGGDQVTINVTANGQSHSVTLSNSPHAQLDAIAATLNGFLPETHAIYYNALVYPEIYALPDGEP